MPRYCPRCGETLHTHSSTTKGETRKTARKAYVDTPAEKKTRGPSAYNLEYKKQYARLAKKHPRTSFAGLAKKAHRATKKVRN